MMAGLGGMVRSPSSFRSGWCHVVACGSAAYSIDDVRFGCCISQVAQGMALGTGSALAHTAINSVFGSRHPDPVQVQQVSCATCIASLLWLTSALIRRCLMRIMLRFGSISRPSSIFDAGCGHCGSHARRSVQQPGKNVHGLPPVQRGEHGPVSLMLPHPMAVVARCLGTIVC